MARSDGQQESAEHFRNTMPPNNAQRWFAYETARENIEDGHKLRETKTFIYSSRIDKDRLAQLLKRWGKELP